MIDLEQLKEEAEADLRLATRNELASSVRVLQAAARELLAGEKIWWCDRHEAAGFDTGKRPMYFCKIAYMMDTKIGTDEAQTCRMVPALLLINGEGKE